MIQFVVTDTGGDVTVAQLFTLCSKIPYYGT